MNEFIMNNLLDAAADETVVTDTTTTETTAIEGDTDPVASEPQKASWSDSVGTIVMMVVMVVVFYFLLIRPQRKKDKAVKNMLDSLKVGDRICTIGGLYGTITAIKNDTITLAMGGQQNPTVVARWAIRSVEDAETENDAEPTA